jgi:hypothetical protein
MIVRVIPAIGAAIVLTMAGPALARGMFDPIPMEIPNPEASPGYVHLSSRPTEAGAEAAAAELTLSWGKWFEGHRALIRRVDQGKHGVRFQVLLKTRTMGEAWRICMNIRGAGYDCFVGPL